MDTQEKVRKKIVWPKRKQRT